MLSIEQFVVKMTIYEMSADKIFIGDMTVDKMTADKIFTGKMSRQYVCRQDVCR